jgi:hypothetical protein
MSDHDIDQVYNHIRALGTGAAMYEESGGWGYKQDLYRIKELVDHTLKHTPTFPNEDEWLTYREKQRIINILSK